MIARIWRCGIAALALLLVSAPSFAAEPELSADAPITADFNTNELVATGNARFSHDEIVVEADEIRFDQTSRAITATGNVRVTRRGLRIVSDRITYNVDTRAFASAAFRAGTPPVFVEGAGFSGDLDKLELSQAQFFLPGTR